MLTVELDPGAATPAEAAARLGIDRADIDEEFGVVSIDPEQHLYTVLVSEEAGARARRSAYSNPRIEPFGPRRSG